MTSALSVTAELKVRTTFRPEGLHRNPMLKVRTTLRCC
jgi:hypothetical protein